MQNGLGFSRVSRLGGGNEWSVSIKDNMGSLMVMKMFYILTISMSIFCL